VADVVIAREVLQFLADNEVPPCEDGVRRVWLEVALDGDAMRVQWRHVGDADFPKGGAAVYWDTTPVFWVNKSVTRGQFYGLADGYSKHLPDDEPLPPEMAEIGFGDFLNGALFVTFPRGLTRQQFRDIAWAIDRAVPGADLKFQGIELGSGLSLSISDGSEGDGEPAIIGAEE
jgi:hypothetical protein